MACIWALVAQRSAASSINSAAKQKGIALSGGGKDFEI
jgi:hypothetical protein